MVCNMSDVFLRCLVAAVFVAFISAMPYMGIDDWDSKGQDFEGPVTAEELRQELFDSTAADSIYNSQSKEFDRLSRDTSPDSSRDNGLVTSHRTKRFGFGLFPMSLSYRLPFFPRRNRRFNSRNYVAMRGKRLNRLDGLELDDLAGFDQEDVNDVTKRRGFTALRGR